MTFRNDQAGCTRRGRSPQRVIVPLLLFVMTIAAAGCLQQAGFSETNLATPRSKASAPLQAPAPAARLGPEDPNLGMNALAGEPAPDVIASSVQVLPEGNVGNPPSPQAVDLLPTTVTRWVQNAAPTTLWSGPDSNASAFTDLPESSYLRVVGPDDGPRIPVYYVGDGLLRRAGNGWVDSSAIQTVDAPAPGQVPAVDADANQPLPVWVQAHRATMLWSGPDDKAVQLTDLPQWTFLKVGGVERGGRLLVNYAGDYASRQPGIGWVDQDTVGPSGDPGRWVTNHRATSLWSGVDNKAIKFTDLPQWSKLRIVEGAPVDSTRMQIEFFGDGTSRQPGIAWIARTDIGPITPPVPLPAPPVVKATTGSTSASGTTTTPQREQHNFASTDDFVNAVGVAAQRSRQTTGVPASVTVAQAILESDWGRSRLTRQGNNLFGIKALGGASGPAGIVTLATWEHVDDGDVVVQAPFKAYYTLEQSIDDHGAFFTRNKRYSGALAVAKDARAFARAIQDAGYATDPSYASKLIGLMDRYNLYRFDS